MAKKQEEKFTAEEVVGTPPKKIVIWLSTLGLLTIVVGTLIPLLYGANQAYATLPQFYKYIFGAGALMLFIARAMNRYTGCVMRVRRLIRIELWSAFFFCVATFFLFYQPNQSRDWLAFTLAGAVLRIYTSIAIPRAMRKALK